MTNRPDRRTLRLPHRGAVAATTALWTRPAEDLDRVGPVHGSSRAFRHQRVAGVRSNRFDEPTLDRRYTGHLLDMAKRQPGAQTPTIATTTTSARTPKPAKANCG